ncbi:MAG: sugar ABC transporter permease [Bacilli bacterium]|nr:sugar ABC transporter permease [Bacilli bacterium]
MKKNGKHILKAIASAILPGSGQLFNKQVLKALFFFAFFLGFMAIELGTSHYFETVDPYDKLTSETGPLFTDNFSDSFYRTYLFDNLSGDESFPEFEDYYNNGFYPEGSNTPVSQDGLSMEELLYFVGEQIKEASTARYFVLGDDLITSASTAVTSNTGELKATDLIIGTDDTAIDAMGFLDVVYGATIYMQNDVEYYRIITGSDATREVYYQNVNDATDILYEDDVVDFTEYKRTTSLYYDNTNGKVFIKSTISDSVLGSSDYRYTNVLDSSDYYDATDEANWDYFNSLLTLDIKGDLVFSSDDVFYVRYIPELSYEMVHGYNGTAFTDYFRNFITMRYFASETNFDAGMYNRMLIEVYFSIHPELRTTFETQYYNFFYDKAGSFTRGVWSLITLGTAEKVVYNYKSLHDPLKSVAFSSGGISYGAVDGILDETPLMGHVSSYLLIQGLIFTILLAYFFMAYVWNIRDAYKTSLKFADTKQRVSDKQWFKEIFTHGFEYFMMFPAIFVISFIAVMPILFGFLIAFTSFSGYDSDTGLFTWVGFQNFTRIFSFGEGIPFAETFWSVLYWTVIWTIASTVTVFFGGLFLAVVINSDRVPFKKFWRTFLILPWAVPALISQMAFSVIFSERGVVNSIFSNIGLYDVFEKWGILGQTFNADTMSAIQQIFYLGNSNIQWFTNANNFWFVRIALIVINIWLGAPYFMALMTSIMTSIDKTLYEAADIDGANKGQKFRFITFPLVMYSTAPILVMTFSGNFNNFGVIYFITQGGTGRGDIDTAFAGKTDILISWMYTLTVEKKVYNMASVFSILIFILLGTVGAWNFSKTRAFKED